MEKLFLYLTALAYFFCRIAQYGLAISTDDWAILKASRLTLEGHFPAGDPNKTFELIVGLIPAFFDKPALFPLISALFASASCVALYNLAYFLTDNKPLALSGWGALLISPVLYWQALNCNSVVYATCFLIWSLHYFTAGRLDRGCLMLMLAGFCRPEPFILAVPSAFYIFMQWRQDNLATARLVRAGLILALPPFWLLLFNFMKTGNAASSFLTVQNYTKTTLLDFDFFNFPPVFWNLLSTYYMNYFAILAAIGGIVLFLFRRLYFLYSYLVFTILGYWILGAMHFTLIERFLLPVHIYMIVFSLLLFNEVKNKLSSLPDGGQSFSLATAFLPFIFLLLNLNLTAHGAIAHNLSYNADFDDDIPKVALLLRKDFMADKQKHVKILMTARRAAMLSYLLHDIDSRYTTIDFGALLAGKTDLRKEQIDLVVYAPNDIYPLPSAFYTFDLLSDGGLKNQGIHVAETSIISEHTRLLHIAKNLQ